MRFLSLFSGIGGLDLGLEAEGWEPVAFCEQDEYARGALARHWPGVPCHDDVRTLDPHAYGTVDAVVGGFPCQDISSAGKGAGLSGERSGLWWEMHRVIDAIRPRWVIAENVPALRTRGADGVLESLEGIGYACWPFVVGADSLGAPQRRKRVFIVGRMGDTDSDSVREQRRGSGRDRPAPTVADRRYQSLADSVGKRPGAKRIQKARPKSHERHHGLGDTHDPRPQGHAGHGDESGASLPIGPDSPHGVRFPPGPDDYTQWRMVLQVRPELAPAQAEPGVCRVADGVPRRVARRAWRNQLRGLGNAVVPQCGQLIARAINKYETRTSGGGVVHSRQPRRPHGHAVQD